MTRNQIIELYTATFNRAADAAGVAYWETQTNLTQTEMANAFVVSAEAVALYPAGQTNTQYIEAIYTNLFGHAADAAGLAYWLEQLDTGALTKEDMVVATVNGALGADQTILDNKTAASTHAVEIGSNDKAISLATVTADSSTIAAVNTTIDASKAAAVAAEQLASIDGETFTLTTGSDDTFVGTDKNDLFDASTKGTLNTGDVLLDSDSDDADILNATVTTASTAARVQNVETVNIDGQYVTTGLALTDVTGTTNLNVNTALAGGTAKVTDANTISVENINAGTNITKLEVTSLTSGTRDTVNVDAGSADAKLTGSAGADKYAVSMAADATLTATAMKTASDALTVNIAGDLTLTTEAAANSELALTLVNNAATASTVTATNGTGAIAKTLTLSGNDIVVDAGDALSLAGTSVTAGGTKVTSDASSSTIELSANLGASEFLNKAVVDNVLATADLGTAAITVNEASKIVLDETQTDLTMNIDNATGDIAAAGTLLLDVNKAQTLLTSGDQVETLFVTAGALENDTDGNAQQVVLGTVVTDAATDTVVLNGANDLTINTLTNQTDDTIVATSMTGDLTIKALAENATIYGGSGDDSITTAVAKVFDIKSGAGDDTIDLITTFAAAAGTKVDAGTGNDKITTSGEGNVVDAGAGDDTVTLLATDSKSDTVTLGAGSDTVILGAKATANDTIKDFAKGEDTLVLTGTAAAALDLTDLTVVSSTNKYVLDTAAFNVTLKGITATDLSDSIQLGNEDAAYEAFAAAAVVAGAKDDVIAISGANTITTGAGSDTVVVAAGAANAATITDFTTGSDKVVLTGAANASTVVVDLTNVTVASGEITVNDDFIVTLNNGANAVLADGTTDKDASTMIQLGQDGAAFTADAATTDITGGTFDDVLALGTGGVNVNFINDGGMDTITGFLNANSDKLVFGAIDGIVAGQSGKAITEATKATSGDVYVMTADTAINGDKIDYSKIGSNVNDVKVKVTDASIMEDVAAYLSNALTDVAANHTYTAVINDDNGDDAYAYLINATSETITASDISLIGTITATATDIVAADIA